MKFPQSKLARDKFMPETHLRHPGFTCSTCEPFTKNKNRIQNWTIRIGQNLFSARHGLWRF